MDSYKHWLIMHFYGLDRDIINMIIKLWLTNESIIKIINHLRILDITYPPCQYGIYRRVGCIGSGGLKYGPDPLENSIRLTIKLKTTQIDVFREIYHAILWDTKDASDIMVESKKS